MQIFLTLITIRVSIKTSHQTITKKTFWNLIQNIVLRINFKMNAIILLSFLLVINFCIAANPWEPEAKTGGWMQRHENLLAMTKAHKNEIKVVFLGDSITEGWAYNGKKVWDKHYAPIGAYNYGIGGDTTQNVLYRIQNHEFDDISPKVLVLKIGKKKINAYRL